MKESEKKAQKILREKHGVMHTKRGSIAGNMKEEGEAPTVTMKHGPIARLLGLPPKEV